MLKIGKKILCTLLVVIMCLTSVPLSGFVGLGASAETTEYKVGDIVHFGSYPQSKVTDSATITALNALAPAWDNWTSYGYYSGTGNSLAASGYGTMVQGDWMRYTDIMYNGNKYRGVKFTQFRPRATHYTSYQAGNGNGTNTAYGFFKFEPIDWRVLDPATGLVMCETIIDSQPYSNTIYNYGGGTYGYFNCYTNYANDYETSSIRQWLNDDFYNTAFTDSEKKEITTTTLNNDGCYTLNGTTGYEKLDSNSTNDKIFLLSYNEVRNSYFGFNSSASAYDPARFAQGSDYAQSQGLDECTSSGSTYNNNSPWLLRSPGVSSISCCTVGIGGNSDGSCPVSLSCYGVRPALCFNLIPKSGNLSFTSESYEMYVGSNSTTDNNNITLKYTVEKAEELEGFDVSDVTLTAGDSSYLRVNKCMSLGLSNEGKTVTIMCDVKALKMGETTLTATIGDVGSTSCNIKMIPPNELEISLKDAVNYYSAEQYFFDEDGNYSGDCIELGFNFKNHLREESAVAIVEQAIKDELKIKNIKFEFTLSGNGLVFDETKSTSLTKEYEFLELYDSEEEKLKLICTNPDMLDSIESVKGNLSYKVYFDDLTTGENVQKGTDEIEFSIQSYKRKYITEHVNATTDEENFKPILMNSIARQMKGLEKTGDFFWAKVMSKGLVDNAISLFTDFNEVNGYEIVIADILSTLNSSNKEEQSQMFGGAFFDFCSAVFDSLVGFYGENYINDVFEALGGEKGRFTLKEITDIVANKTTSGPAYKAFEKLISNDEWANALDNVAAVGKFANTALVAYGVIKDTVNGVQKAASITSACNAYEEMLKNNMDVFIKLQAKANADGNDDLAEALGNYINYENSSAGEKIANAIAATVVNGGGSVIQVGVMALANAIAQGTVETVVGIIGSALAGFDCGRLLSNILCNSSDYAEASCAVVASGYISESLLKVIVDIQGETALESDVNNAYEKAKNLDFALRMYKAIENIAYDKTVAALNAEGSSVVVKALSDEREAEYKTVIADMLARKADIQHVECHDTSLAAVYSKIIDLGYSASGNVNGKAKAKYKVLCVQCPVDVLVTNSKGEVVAQIVNDELVSQVEGIDIVVYEDEKYICVPDTDEYNIIITATAAGEMDYTVFEYNENGDNIREVEYSDIPLYYGQKFTGKVDKLNLSKSDNYNLTTDSKTIYADKDEYLLSEGHKYTASIINATCTENGKRVYTCTCGDTYTETITTSGHSLGVWYTVTPATCEAYGVEQRDCLVCDYSETQNIPAIGHKFAEGQSKCNNCDYNKADMCSCKCHKTGFIARLIWKITILFNKLLRRSKVCPCGVYHY